MSEAEIRPWIFFMPQLNRSVGFVFLFCVCWGFFIIIFFLRLLCLPFLPLSLFIFCSICLLFVVFRVPEKN